MVKNVSKNSKIKSLKQRYNNEFDFISNLLNVANIPSQQSDSSGIYLSVILYIIKFVDIIFSLVIFYLNCNNCF